MLSEQGEAGQVSMILPGPPLAADVSVDRRDCVTVMESMRLAWFSPLPPDRSGIATCCAELLPLLARNHEIEAFVDDGRGREVLDRTCPIPGVALRGAHDFPWRHATAPFDLAVYQLGNELCHDYIWPYVVHYPGLVVLHDGQLHHARSAGLIRCGRLDDYRAEYAYSHPDAPPALHEVVIAGMGDAVPSLYFEHPLVRVPVEAARLVAVHNQLLADELTERIDGALVAAIRQGVNDLTAGLPGTSGRLRTQIGIPSDAVVFAAFGRATPEKRLVAVLTALAQMRAAGGAGENAWLLCVGATTTYFDVRALAARLGVEDRLVVTGYVPDEELGRYLALADVGICLRWPTGRETSASWLRCLAAGKPTFISGLAHLTSVPVIDPRTMDTLPVGDVAEEDRDPIGMIVELTDEVQMLRLGMRRLAEGAALRARLGAAARRYWTRHATVELMAQDYEALLRRARNTEPRPHTQWPEHLLADGTGRARAIIGHMGAAADWLVPGLTSVDHLGPGHAG